MVTSGSQWVSSVFIHAHVIFLQVASSCDFFMYLSHIQKGIIKGDSKKMCIIQGMTHP